MSDAVGYYAVVGKPSLRERLWRWLGFRHRFDEALWKWRNEPTDGFAEGVITTTVAVRLGKTDRLRLLVSGHCEVAVYTKTSVLVEHAVTRSQFAVLSPARKLKDGKR